MRKVMETWRMTDWPLEIVRDWDLKKASETFQCVKWLRKVTVVTDT